MSVRNDAWLVAATLFAATLVATAASAAPATERASAANDEVVHSDFNGDGFADLAIASPSEAISGEIQAGMVHVLYGSANGPRGEGSQMFTQATAGVTGVPQRRDFFGNTLATGDFDDDGFADLAIGVPREDIGAKADAGLVELLYGSTAGLTPATSFTYKGTVGGSSHCTCRFGEALAAGDFNEDGVADLAIGAPRTPERSVFVTGSLRGRESGTVVVLYGKRTAAGLSAAGATTLRPPQDFWNNVLFSTVTADFLEFGQTLAAGDHDGDGDDELAVGIPGFRHVSPFRDDGGAVALFNGSGLGVRRTPVSRGGYGYLEAEVSPRFGEALAFGDFNGNGKDELVIAAPRKDDEAGAIVIFATFSDIFEGGRWVSQSNLYDSKADSNDLFGYALAAGDFNGDGRDDLAVAVPFENFSGKSNAGIVHVLRGTSNGLRTGDAKIFHQDKPDMAGAAESGDVFGRALGVGNFNGDIVGTRGRDDLVIGVPGEKVGGKSGAGLVHVLFGSSEGVTATGSMYWTQDSAEIADQVGIGDNFGGSLP